MISGAYMQDKGFSLVETLVALAIAGVLVAVAVPSYKFYVAHAQVSESLKSATMRSFTVGQNLQSGRCTAVAGVNDVYPNRYGTLTISGAKVISKGENCPSGCTATFKFNNTTDKALQGKQVVFNILNNQKVSFVSSTVDSRYLSKDLKTIPTTSADNCTAIPDQPLTPTGSNSPSGSSTTTTPSTPTPTDPTVPTNPNNPTNPTDPTNPTNPTDPTVPGNGSNITDPTNPANNALVLHVNNKYQSSGARSDNFYVKSSINVYDDIVNVLKKTPNSNTSLQIIVDSDVAVVGNNTQTPAFYFDSRLPAGMKITVVNNGYILGRGGDGVDSVKPGSLYNPDASSSVQQKVYRNEGRSGTIYQDLLPIYIANYPFPSNVIPGVNVHFDEELTLRIDDWYLMGTSAINDGGDAIKLNTSAKVDISNNRVIAGGGGGGYALYDFESGQDSGADAESGSGGAPFGKTPSSARQNASLLKVDITQSIFGGAGLGGEIGKNGEQISRSSMVNRNRYHKAGCAFNGNGLRIKNIGSSAQVLGNGSCPVAPSF
jgi:prepilin-type N-terminal cleavage/methylation domain-containing protein